MFQLIVAVISIALIAALAIASIFYGGDAFTKSSTKAQVTTLINQGQQIAGAAALYKTDGGFIANGEAAVTQLVTDGYLAAVPAGNKLTGSNDATPSKWEIATVDGASAPNAARIAYGASVDTGVLCDATEGEVVKQGAGKCADATGAAGVEYFQFAL